MPKVRTNKTAAKRFKITGTGKITRRKSHNNHMFLHKGGSQKRRLELEPVLFKGEEQRVRRLLVLGYPKAPQPGPAPAEVRAEKAKAARAKLLSMVSGS